MVTSASGRTSALVQDDGSPARTFEGIPTTAGDEVLLALDEDGTTAWSHAGAEVWSVTAGEADALFITGVTESAANVPRNVAYTGEHTDGLTTRPDDGTARQGAVVALDESDGSFGWAEDYGTAGVDDGPTRSSATGPDDTATVTFEHELDHSDDITMWPVADGVHYVASINNSGSIDDDPVTPASSDHVRYGLLP